MVNRKILLDCIHTWAAGRRSWRRPPGPCCPWSCRRPSPPPGASPGCGPPRMRGTCYPRTPPARAGSRMWGLNRVIVTLISEASWSWSHLTQCPGSQPCRMATAEYPSVTRPSPWRAQGGWGQNTCNIKHHWLSPSLVLVTCYLESGQRHS